MTRSHEACVNRLLAQTGFSATPTPITGDRQSDASVVAGPEISLPHSRLLALPSFPLEVSAANIIQCLRSALADHLISMIFILLLII
jgi:hypothetical protein